jgi:hypothetical protein
MRKVIYLLLGIFGLGCAFICVVFTAIFAFGMLQTFETDRIVIYYPSDFESTLTDETGGQFMRTTSNSVGGNDLIMFSTYGNPYDFMDIKDQESCNKAIQLALEDDSVKGLTIQTFPEQNTYTRKESHGVCSFYVEINQSNIVMSAYNRILIDQDSNQYSIIGIYEKNHPLAFKVKQAIDKSTLK